METIKDINHSGKPTGHERADIYTHVTNQIIAAIEAGAGRFQMPWHMTTADCFAPLNALSQQPYRGINILTLWAAASARDYASGAWATYRQWRQLGAQVRTGEKATMIVLWKHTERPDDEETEDATAPSQPRRWLLARGFFVFNAAQVDGFSPPVPPLLPESERVAEAERFFAALQADIRHGGSRAFYDIRKDRIRLPTFADFRSGDGYYSTLAHEITHWTGAKSRLGRDFGRRFGDDAYSPVITRLLAVAKREANRYGLARRDARSSTSRAQVTGFAPRDSAAASIVFFSAAVRGIFIESVRRSFGGLGGRPRMELNIRIKKLPSRPLFC